MLKIKERFLVGFFLVCLTSCQSELKRPIVVDVEFAFEDYQMQKDLRSRVDRFISLEQSKIDSLKKEAYDFTVSLQKKGTPNNVDLEKLNQYETLLMSKQQTFDEETNKKIKEYDQMINVRITENLEKFAKRLNVDLIFSKGGAFPGVLYNDDTLDRTDDFIQFINNEYAGQ